MSFTIRRGPIAADNYTIVANALLRDHRLSLKARGLAGWLLSHRHDFELTQTRIAELNGVGVDAIRTGVEELERLGYLRRERARDEQTGQLGGSVYFLTDSPVSAGDAQSGISQDRPTQDRPIQAHKKTTSQEDHQEIPAAVASEPALDLPEVEDELAKRRAEQSEAKPLTLNQRATRLAQAHYERLGKMGNVVAMMKIIRKALERNYSDADVDRVLEWLADRRWTLTEERLANALRGGPLPAGNTAPTTTRNQARTGPDGRGPILEFN